MHIVAGDIANARLTSAKTQPSTAAGTQASSSDGVTTSSGPPAHQLSCPPRGGSTRCASPTIRTHRRADRHSSRARADNGVSAGRGVRRVARGPWRINRCGQGHENVKARHDRVRLCSDSFAGTSAPASTTIPRPARRSSDGEFVASSLSEKDGSEGGPGWLARTRIVPNSARSVPSAVAVWELLRVDADDHGHESLPWVAGWWVPRRAT
jgi:hypothetical protein